jgi:hypothetical protein
MRLTAAVIDSLRTSMSGTTFRRVKAASPHARRPSVLLVGLLCATGCRGGCSPTFDPADLSWSWTAPVAHDGPPGPVIVDGSCFAREAFIKLVQRGTDVDMTLQPSRFWGGVPLPDRGTVENAKGTRSRDHVTLRGEAVRDPNEPTSSPTPHPSRTPLAYDLMLDAKTGHLAGTRNGSPVWLSRLVVNKPSECPNVP